MVAIALYHPYELTYFKDLVGGLRRASEIEFGSKFFWAALPSELVSDDRRIEGSVATASNHDRSTCPIEEAPGLGLMSFTFCSNRKESSASPIL